MSMTPGVSVRGSRASAIAVAVAVAKRDGVRWRGAAGGVARDLREGAVDGGRRKGDAEEGGGV